MATFKLRQDYYGNKDYGKRAFYLLDENGNQTHDFVFIDEVDEWADSMRSEGHTVEIEYSEE
jgi:hypothetical protein